MSEHDVAARSDEPGAALEGGESLALDGLDGTNPLHVLAALGALALSDDLDAGGARLGWTRVRGAYVPRIRTATAPAAWCEAIAARLRAMAAVKPDESGPAARRRVEALRKAEKSLLANAKQLRKDLAAEAAKLGLGAAAKRAHGQERVLANQAEIDAARRGRAEAEEQLAASLGFGPAHLGEVIGVPPSVFRAHARHALAHAPSTARQLSSLASDGCLDDRGNVAPTPYSFSNGSSGKKLLKDFRALAAKCDAARVEASLVRGEPRLEDETALNWDPADLRSYAHQWRDPAVADAQVDVAANALAYAGLGVLTCFPGARGLEALGFVRERGASRFCWPLWEPLLSLDLVRATFASVTSSVVDAGRDAVTARGLLGVFASKLDNPTGKRNFFARATPAGPASASGRR